MTYPCNLSLDTGVKNPVWETSLGSEGAPGHHLWVLREILSSKSKIIIIIIIEIMVTIKIIVEVII